MLQALKKVAGAVGLAAFMVLGCMTAFADDEVQNPPSPHVVYQVFTDGQWKNEAMDKQSASDSASPVEGLKVWLTGVDGSISYRVYLHDGGWQGWVSDGAVAGGENTGNQIEAIQVKLSGYAGQVLDVWYRATVSGKEKLGLAMTGSPAGTVGEGKPLTSLEAYLTEVNHNESDGTPSVRTNLPFGFYDDNGVTRYTDVPGGVFTGWVDHDGVRYYVRDNSFLTGWQYLDGLKFYFDEQGKLVQDLDPIIGIQSSYVIKVNKQLNTLIPYAKDGDNGYIIPVKSMLCSVGDDTPLGTFHTPEKYRWRLMVNDTYTQYATRITAGQGFLIHSVCYDKPDIYTMQSVGYNGLGVVRSLGCIRLTAENAKWVYDNCPIGTTIEIFEDPVSVGPYYKPTVTPIPVEQTWDPTDPLVSEDMKNQAAAAQQEEAARRQAEEQAAAQAAAEQKAAEEAAEKERQEVGPGFGL